MEEQNDGRQGMRRGGKRTGRVAATVATTRLSSERGGQRSVESCGRLSHLWEHHGRHREMWDRDLEAAVKPRVDGGGHAVSGSSTPCGLARHGARPSPHSRRPRLGVKGGAGGTSREEKSPYQTSSFQWAP